DRAVERTDQAAGSSELLVLRRCSFERIRHRRRVINRVGQAARLPRVEAPVGATARAQVQSRQRVDLTCMGNRRDRSEDPLRLIDAGAVVGPNPPQVRFDNATSGDLFGQNGLLYPFDRGFVNLEPWRAPLRGLLRTP